MSVLTNACVDSHGPPGNNALIDCVYSSLSVRNYCKTQVQEARPDVLIYMYDDLVRDISVRSALIFKENKCKREHFSDNTVNPKPREIK